VSEAQDWTAAVRTLARLSRLLESVDAGLTLPQYRVLAALTQGGDRSAHLAARIAVRKPTLTVIADALVAAGYATRKSEPGDRRVVRLHVTPAGQAALATADERYVARLASLLAEIGYPDRFVADLIDIGAALDARLVARSVT
jgi:DNA-binding MarR family transcriptional regulator